MPYLFIDIETIPAGEYPSLDKIEAPSNYKNEEAILKYKMENQDKIYRKRALNSLQGEIAALSFMIANLEDSEYEHKVSNGEFNDPVLDSSIITIVNTNGGEVQTNLEHNVVFVPNEYLLISYFEKILPKVYNYVFVGHNISSFDLQWLFNRAIKYKCKYLAGIVPIRKYDSMYVDTMIEVNATNTYGFNSLADCCNFFGIPTKKNEFSGNDVFDAYKEGKFLELALYCKDDVKSVINLFSILEFNTELYVAQFGI